MMMIKGGNKHTCPGGGVSGEGFILTQGGGGWVWGRGGGCDGGHSGWGLADCLAKYIDLSGFVYRQIKQAVSQIIEDCCLS